MQSFVLGISGGSGSGKSTLAFGIQDALPAQTLVFHLDDYFKPETEVPQRAGFVNWDDPEALYHQKMTQDLKMLKSGQPATINTKSPRLNPEFLKTGKRIPITFQSKPLIVVEGFLSLHYPDLRELFDTSVYLEAPFELHTARRVHGKLHAFPPEYDELVLQPMHKQFVAPSKQYATEVIDVSEQSAETVLAHLLEVLKKHGIA